MSRADGHWYFQDVVDKTSKPMTPDEIGVLVRTVRKAMGWKQFALADAASISLSSLERVERRAIAESW